MTLLKRLLILVAATLAIAFAEYAAIPIGTLAGTVLDAHGRPVVSAAVTIQTSDGLKPFATHTDSEGHFRIDRLETGQYDLRASSAGLISEWTKRVMVHSKKTTTVTLRLRPSKPPSRS